MGAKAVAKIGKRVEGAIVRVRDERVILDEELAALYGVTTKALNQAVRRNRARFPSDFMFQLGYEEWESLRSQSVTSNGRGGRRTLPFAFTEQGVAMTSSVLHSRRAIAVNIEIMRAFVRLRAMLSAHQDLSRKLGALERKYDGQFRVVFRAIHDLMDAPPVPPSGKPPARIGFGPPRRGRPGAS